MSKYTLHDLHAVLGRQKENRNVLQALETMFRNDASLAATASTKMGFESPEVFIRCLKTLYADACARVDRSDHAIGELLAGHIGMIEAAIRCGYLPEKPERYIAVIKSCAIHDVQVCTDTNHDPTNEDAWEDVNDAEVYLGIFDGPEADALQNAAVFGRTDPYNIQLIAI